MRVYDLLTQWRNYIISEDIKSLDSMLKKTKFPIDTPLERGLTGILLAILENRNDSAAFLILKGADLNAKNENGLTPLMLAVLRRNTYITKRLINSGALPNLVDKYQNNALFYAIQNNHIEIVEMLLQHKSYSIHPEYETCRDLLKRIQSPVFSLLRKYEEHLDPVCIKAIHTERLRRMFH